MNSNFTLRFIRFVPFLLFVVLVHSAYSQTFTPKYSTKIITKVNGYYEYLPQGYSATGSTLYPTIISIGGIGQMGDGSTSTTTGLPLLIGDVNRPDLQGGLPTYIKKGKFPVSVKMPNSATSFKFIVICPQFKSPNFSPYPTPLDVDSVISYVVSHYKVDTKRIYITGFSVGGGIAWDYTGYSINYANRVAAIVPISGGTNDSLAKKARTLTKANLPVWAFHNTQDPSVPVAITNRWVDSINKAPAPNPLARKTLFPLAQHDAWTKTYDSAYKETISGYNYNVYQWMLLYQRTPLTASANSNSPVCKDTTLSLSANSITGATYKWTGPNGFTSTSRTPSLTHPTTAAAGTYTVTLTYNGLTKSASTTVTVTTVATTFYRDADGDGYGAAAQTKVACAKPSGYVTKLGDCNDTKPGIHPGAKEVLGNGIDDDCDGQIDETTSTIVSTRLITEAGAEPLTIQARPNPSTDYFLLNIQNSSRKPAQLRVVDILGRVVELRNNITAGTLTFGQNYKTGIYYVEVKGENQKAMVKCIKQ